MKYGDLPSSSKNGTRLTERSIRVVKKSPDLPEWFNSYKLNYEAARATRTRRERHLLGGTADAHYNAPIDMWRMREFARDMDRNDVFVGQLIDRVIDNVIGPGLKVEPDTGDPVLNQELSEFFNMDWGLDPLQCDLNGKHDWFFLQRLALRHTLIDGDVFSLLGPQQLRSGVGLFEADMVAGGAIGESDVVHGVVLEPATARPIAYLMVKDALNRKFRQISQPVSKTSAQLTRIERFDTQGNPQVLHVYDPQRVTQSRGVTVLRAVFDSLSMFEDLNFAKLLQQQVVSCIAAFINRTQDHQLGPREQAPTGYGTTETLEKLSPGMIARLLPGETIQGFSPNVPNAEFFQHVRLILRLISVNVGLPLEISLMDTTDTTFHGYRGALQQARMGFQAMQRWLPSKFQSEVYRFKARQFLGLERTQNDPRLLRHRWMLPGWPYVDPQKDAAADQVRLQNGLASPRRVQGERGFTWEHTAREIVEDYGLIISLALEKAEEINSTYPNAGVSWRDVANLSVPSGAQVVRQESSSRPEQEQDMSIEKTQALLEAARAVARGDIPLETGIDIVLASFPELEASAVRTALKPTETFLPRNELVEQADRKLEQHLAYAAGMAQSVKHMLAPEPGPQPDIHLKIHTPPNNVLVQVPERETHIKNEIQNPVPQVHIKNEFQAPPQESNFLRKLKITKRNKDGSIAEAEVRED